MGPKLPVILYHYDASPFATKVKNMLALKKIPHIRVDVPMILPRPMLSSLLGVTYRRIPILAIGNDVYCDSSLIASVLERRFPSSDGYNTLFPPRKGGGKADTGLTKALSMYWIDRSAFLLAAGSLPYNKFDEKFIQDRNAWQGTDVRTFVSRQPEMKSALSSHLTLLEEQLSDGREWLMDTEHPGLADISAHFMFSWLQYFKSLKDLFNAQTFPNSLTWLARMSSYIQELEKAHAAPFEKISGDDAAKLICSSEGQVEFNFDKTEASRLGLSLGDVVSVVPQDNGKIPTIGKLVHLDREEVVIETQGSAGTVRCHFPRLNFTARNLQTSSAKL